MFSANVWGKIFLIVGLILAGAGLALLAGWRIPWLGRLPGDISIHKDGFSFYFPITTSIIFSLIISLILHLFKK